MSDKHAPGRLTIEGYGSEYVDILDKYGGDVADAVLKADAKRLVACWNACEGMSTEAIEALDGIGTMGDLKAAYSEAKAHSVTPIVNSQNKELAVARALLVEVLLHINPGASKWTENGIEFLRDKVRTFLAEGTV